MLRASFAASLLLATATHTAAEQREILARPPVTGPNTVIFNATIDDLISTKFEACTMDGKSVFVSAYPLGLKKHVEAQTANNKPDFQARMAASTQAVTGEFQRILAGVPSSALPFRGELVDRNPDYINNMAKSLEENGFPITVTSVNVYAKHNPDAGPCFNA